MLTTVAFIQYIEKQTVYFYYAVDFDNTDTPYIFWRRDLQMRPPPTKGIKPCHPVSYDGNTFRNDKAAAIQA